VKTLAGKILLSFLVYSLAATAPAASGKASAVPAPTPPQKQGDRPAPSPAIPGTASAPAAPSAGLPSSSARLPNTPQHMPDQLNFGSVVDGTSVTRTFTLLTNSPGYVSLTIPPGPFRVSEFRELGPPPGGSKNLPPQSQPTAVPGIRSRIRYQKGQNGPYQWNMAPNTQMQVDVVFTPRSQDTQVAGVETAIMNVTGPGPHGNWVITVTLRAMVNGFKAESPLGTHNWISLITNPGANWGRVIWRSPNYAFNPAIPDATYRVAAIARRAEGV